MIIYADNAASTPISRAAWDAMRSAPDGNPSSTHAIGRKAALALERARERIAQDIGADPDEIYFTSGGTEGNALALRMMASASERIAVSAGEHSSIIAKTTNKIPLLGDGRVDPNVRVIGSRAVMLANNETGVVNPIHDLIRGMPPGASPLFFSDAVAAVGHIPINVHDMGVDYLTAGAHKFGGPPGVGFLYIRRGAPIRKAMAGGGQERGVRPGSVPVPLVCGMAAALHERVSHLPDAAPALADTRDWILERLLAIPGAHLNGDCAPGDYLSHLPGTLNIRFDNVPSGELISLVDAYGVCISAGSACHSNQPDPSHVLLAMGLSKLESLSSVRISLREGQGNREADSVVRAIEASVGWIRDSAVQCKGDEKAAPAASCGLLRPSAALDADREMQKYCVYADICRAPSRGRPRSSAGLPERIVAIVPARDELDALQAGGVVIHGCINPGDTVGDIECSPYGGMNQIAEGFTLLYATFLEFYRRQRGVSSRELAERADVVLSSVLQIESGKYAAQNMTAKNLLSLADVLGVPPHALIGLRAPEDVDDTSPPASLLDWIKRRGISQRRLAGWVGISPQRISEIVSGTISLGNVTARNFLSIADALKVDPHLLIL